MHFSQPLPHPHIVFHSTMQSDTLAKRIPIEIIAPPPKKLARNTPSAEAVAASGNVHVNINNLTLRDPDEFKAGELHKHLNEWERILPSDPNPLLIDCLKNKVDVEKFFRPFKGSFQGRSYDAAKPPSRVFKNAQITEKFKEFIDATIQKRLKDGSITYVGKVGECAPPTVVIPLTIEPTKPRLCTDARFVNLWTKPLPFSLDTLADIPLMVKKGAKVSALDEKSGYDHIFLTDNSRQYFGIEWDNQYYTWNTIPFGWAASAWIYHNIGMFATSYVRSLGVAVLQYIDDRCVEECQQDMQFSVLACSSADRALYITCEVLNRLGYTFALRKIQFPSQTDTIFLGMEVDTVLECFHIPIEKKLKFARLREDILSRNKIHLKTLQRIAGKIASFAAAIASTKLYTREMHRAIAAATVPHSASAGALIKIEGPLKAELEFWRFLDNWDKPLKWREERHMIISLATDASSYMWGAAIQNSTQTGSAWNEIGDYWQQGDNRPIHIKEAYALLHTLQAIADTIRHARVDALIDNMALVLAWQRLGCKDPALNSVLQELFQFTMEHDILLVVEYVASKDNPADAPSRRLLAQDAMLAESTWHKVQEQFGPHCLDLMALDSNVMKDSSGKPLRHFSPWPTPLSEATNVFAQTWGHKDKAYAFPPKIMVPHLLRYAIRESLPLTLLVFKESPCPLWWPILVAHSLKMRKIADKGEKHVILLPSKQGFIPDEKGISADLWAVYIGSSHK